MTTRLILDQVGKTFVSQSGTGKVVLEDVTTSVGGGEFVSLVGPSGCGKTTLMRVCAGLLEPTSGTVRYADGDGRSRAAGELHDGHFGVVFQSPALFPWRTVRKNVLLLAEVLGRRGTAPKERAERLLALVGLGEAADKYPHELSGGMQQRVSIARALLTDPDFLFMDEPFGALDAMTRDELNLALQRIHMEAGKTVVFVTHSIQEALFLSDRVLVMTANPGRVVEEITVPFARPRDFTIFLEEEFRQSEARIRELLGHHTKEGAPA